MVRRLAICALFHTITQEIFAVGVLKIQKHSSRKGGTFGYELALERPQPKEKCVVFHSQHKSAGQSITKVLQKYNLQVANGAEAFESNLCACDSPTWDCWLNTCSKEVKGVNSFRSDAPCVKHGLSLKGKGNRVAYKGYTLRLAGSSAWGSAGRGPCVWATMSREPVSRLVSAFLFCKHQSPYDPLCGFGPSALNFSKASIQDFAEYWGNFLFREILWHPELFKLASSRDDFIHDAKCGETRAPWETLHVQLNGGDDPRTPSGAANMKAVEEYLMRGKLYDVIGVAEKWESSMRLFDHLVPLANRTWSDAAAAEKTTHHSENYAKEKEALLARAKHDKYVLDAIAGDRHLYTKFIIPKFRSQLGSSTAFRIPR